MRIFKTTEARKTFNSSPSNFYEKLSNPMAPNSKDVQDFYDYISKGKTAVQSLSLLLFAYKSN